MDAFADTTRVAVHLRILALALAASFTGTFAMTLLLVAAR